MKTTLLAGLALTLLAGCGAQPGPLPILAPSRPLMARAATATHLIVSTVVDEPGIACRVRGRDAQGAFALNMMWQAVPRTYISRLSYVTLNGQTVSASAIAPLGEELRDAAALPENQRFAKQLADVASELGEYQAP